MSSFSPSMSWYCQPGSLHCSTMACLTCGIVEDLSTVTVPILPPRLTMVIFSIALSNLCGNEKERERHLKLQKARKNSKVGKRPKSSRELLREECFNVFNASKTESCDKLKNGNHWNRKNSSLRQKVKTTRPETQCMDQNQNLAFVNSMRLFDPTIYPRLICSLPREHSSWPDPGESGRQILHPHQHQHPLSWWKGHERWGEAIPKRTT